MNNAHDSNAIAVFFARSLAGGYVWEHIGYISANIASRMAKDWPVDTDGSNLIVDAVRASGGKLQLSNSFRRVIG